MAEKFVHGCIIVFKNLFLWFEILKIMFHKVVDNQGSSEQSVSYQSNAIEHKFIVHVPWHFFLIWYREAKYNLVC